ncbi:MAG: hypothetical protein JRG91_00515 [Deltaproteobacteria bacterium]|nr:hypothetical protein [Deltaproteobacteria bacterium]
MKDVKLITLAAAVMLVIGACGGTVTTGTDGGTDGAADPPPADLETDGAPDGDGDPLDDATPDAEEDAAPDPVSDPVSDPPPDGGCAFVQIPFEAEDMTLDSGFQTAESSREYIGTFIENVATSDGQAAIDIEIPCEDTYVLWGLVWWESGSEDSFYWSWDAIPSDRPVWDVMQQCGTSIARDWYWDQVTYRTDTGFCDTPEEDPALMDLTAGTHTFYLTGRERLSAVAEFILTNDLGYTPPDPG